MNGKRRPGAIVAVADYGLSLSFKAVCMDLAKKFKGQLTNTGLGLLRLDSGVIENCNDEATTNRRWRVALEGKTEWPLRRGR